MTQLTEERAKEAWELHQEIIAGENMRRKLMGQNAVKLAKLYKDKLYKELLGDENGEWAGYLANTQIFYTRNQVDTYIRLYNKLTVKLDIHPDIWVEVPLTRLCDILPVITLENYEYWFIQANVLTAKDWHIVMNQAKGNLTEEEHQDHEYSYYKICKQCGQKLLVDSKHIHD